MFLFEDYLIYIVSLYGTYTQQHCNSYLTSLSNTCINICNYITTFLHLGTLDSPSALHLGAILNSEVTNKPAKMKKQGSK